MEWYKILILVIALFVIFACFAIFFVVAAIVYHMVFGVRQERDPNLKYFTPEEFGLNKEDIEISYRGANLYGAIYSTQSVDLCKKLIIFAHGLCAGHCAYTSLIAYYANRGYAVLAYDNFGCDRSEGDNIRTFYAGAEAVVAAYIAAKKDARLKDKPVVLVGHSWGGYSVLCASEKVKAEGVVAFSAFNSPAKAIADQVRNISAFLSFFVRPTCWLINIFKARQIAGNRKAVKAVEQSNTPALLVWGEKDEMVLRRNSAACLSRGSNTESLILPEKKHNPYNTVTAENKLAELFGAEDFENEQEENEFYARFDFVATTEADEEVMQETVKFIENCAMKK